jgi:hypothetical protein
MPWAFLGKRAVLQLMIEVCILALSYEVRVNNGSLVAAGQAA